MPENQTEVTQNEKQQKETPAETVESLRAKLAETEGKLKEREDNVRGLNQTLQQRAKELKEQADLRAEISVIKDTVEILATALSTRDNPDNLDGKTVLSQLESRKKEQEARRKQEETERTNREYEEKAKTLYAKAEEVYGDDEDSLYNIRSLMRVGDLDLAERKVSKAEKAKTTSKKDEPPKETEDQRIEKLVEARLRKKLEEEGLLETYETTPSTMSSGLDEAYRAYAAGEIDEAEARKRGIKF